MCPSRLDFAAGTKTEELSDTQTKTTIIPLSPRSRLRWGMKIMPDNVSDIRAFYDKNLDSERSRLKRHPIEHDVTWRYLDAYLPTTGRILDVGCATGAYTIPLAKRGYHVVAADLSPALVSECEKTVHDTGLDDKVTCLVADARELSVLADSGFDAVLLMGPLYHLVVEEDRKTALGQAFRLLKQGGTIFSAFISRYGIWGDVMRKLPDYVEKQADLKSVLARGRDVDLPGWEGSFRAYYAVPSEVIQLHELAGFKTVVLAGVEPAGVGADEAYSSLSDSQRRLWLDLLYDISREESIVGASCHLLYVGRK